MAKSKFTQELFDSICETLATSSKGLNTVCKEHGISSKQFYQWVANDAQLGEMYARARDEQADFMADEIVELADNTDNDNKGINGSNAVQRDRLRIDARKWVAAKLKPRKYSERVDVTSDGQAIQQIDLSALVAGFMKDAGDKKTT